MALPAPAVADSEEDGMPKEDPSKLERAPGEENEEVLSAFVLVFISEPARLGQYGSLEESSWRLCFLDH